MGVSYPAITIKPDVIGGGGSSPLPPPFLLQALIEMEQLKIQSELEKARIKIAEGQLKLQQEQAKGEAHAKKSQGEALSALASDPAFRTMIMGQMSGGAQQEQQGQGGQGGPPPSAPINLPPLRPERQAPPQQASDPFAGLTESQRYAAQQLLSTLASGTPEERRNAQRSLTFQVPDVQRAVAAAQSPQIPGVASPIPNRAPRSPSAPDGTIPTTGPLAGIDPKSLTWTERRDAIANTLDPAYRQNFLETANKIREGDAVAEKEARKWKAVDDIVAQLPKEEKADARAILTGSMSGLPVEHLKAMFPQVYHSDWDPERLRLAMYFHAQGGKTWLESKIAAGIRTRQPSIDNLIIPLDDGGSTKDKQTEYQQKASNFLTQVKFARPRIDELDKELSGLSLAGFVLEYDADGMLTKAGQAFLRGLTNPKQQEFVFLRKTMAIATRFFWSGQQSSDKEANTFLELTEAPYRAAKEVREQAAMFRLTIQLAMEEVVNGKKGYVEALDEVISKEKQWSSKQMQALLELRSKAQAHEKNIKEGRVPNPIQDNPGGFNDADRATLDEIRKAALKASRTLKRQFPDR